MNLKKRIESATRWSLGKLRMETMNLKKRIESKFLLGNWGKGELEIYHTEFQKEN